jgi:tryptophan-rich sensory protein
MEDSKQWYSKTKKPSWAPPSWLFGPVWSFLYILILISFGFVFIKAFKQEISFILVLPFILNIVFNILFSPIQWGLRSNLLAAIDILFMLITLIWVMVVIYPYYDWVTYMQIPYLLWISFAGILQTVITVLNWENERVRFSSFRI